MGPGQKHGRKSRVAEGREEQRLAGEPPGGPRRAGATQPSLTWSASTRALAFRFIQVLLKNRARES